MAQTTISPDDMPEVIDALCSYINEDEKKLAPGTTYSGFGEILKRNHKHQSSANNGIWVDGTPTKVTIRLNNNIRYELTWNKAAKLIHPVLCAKAAAGADEIMTLEETPIDRAGFTFKTINAVRRVFPNAVTLGDLKNLISDDPKTLNLLDNTEFRELRLKLELSLSEIAESYTDDTETDSTAVQENVETNATAETGFDYSLVDEDAAQYLRKAAARIANSYADIGSVLAEAQERLANNYHGVFEKWYTSIGISKRSLYRLIDIYNFRNQLIKSCQIGTTSESALEIFDNLPKMLQSDISASSAPAEAVNAVLSGDITTHKDFVALKKALERTTEERDRLEIEKDSLLEKNKSLAEDVENLKIDNERLEDENGELTGENTDLEEERDGLKKQLGQVQNENQTVITNYNRLRKDLDMIGDKNRKLELEIKELRERPVETVTVEGNPTESEEYKSLLSLYDNLGEQYDELEEENERLREQRQSVPAGLDHDHLREFFETLYGKADDAFKDCCHFLKEDYPDETKEYVRERVAALYNRFKTYIELNFEED